MKKIALDSIKSVFWKIDKRKKQFQFELFGLDFMIDSEFKVQLIEMNTNPCLETSSPILVKLIPQMLDNAFTIAVDPIFPPPCQPWPNTRKYLIPDNQFSKNKFELIFDEKFLPQDLENYKLKENYLDANQNVINEIYADQQEEESDEENTDEQDENN